MINKIFLILIFLFIFIGCSPSQSSQNIQSDIFDGTYDDIIFSKASFDDLEFKFSKKYDVSELPDALEAHYGFFQRREFEIRFYPSSLKAKVVSTLMDEGAISGSSLKVEVVPIAKNKVLVLVYATVAMSGEPVFINMQYDLRENKMIPRLV